MQKLSSNSIAQSIENCLKNGAINLHVNIWVNDQILFQVMPAKHFLNRGINTTNFKDMVIIHSLNKNKTETFYFFEELMDRYKLFEMIYYESPKGIHNFIKNIGNNAQEIENEIFDNIKIYELKDQNSVRIEYLDH